MRKFLCKIFRFLLNTSKQMLEMVTETLKNVAVAVVDVLGAAAEAVGDVISRSPIGLIAIGVGAYFLFSFLGKKNDKDRVTTRSTSVA